MQNESIQPPTRKKNMSKVKHVKGKMVLLPKEDETLEFRCRSICASEGHKLDFNIYDTYLEYAVDELNEQYMILGDDIYEIIDINRNLEDDFFTVIYEKDGIVHFETRFHDGGDSLESALEDRLKDIEKNKRAIHI